jgi:hypothetical protein
MSVGKQRYSWNKLDCDWYSECESQGDTFLLLGRYSSCVILLYIVHIIKFINTNRLGLHGWCVHMKTLTSPIIALWLLPMCQGSQSAQRPSKPALPIVHLSKTPLNISSAKRPNLPALCNSKRSQSNESCSDIINSVLMRAFRTREASQSQ